MMKINQKLFKFGSSSLTKNALKTSYSFGMLMPGRGITPVNAYRYGFNGKEKDDEAKGNGNELDFGARIYDSRLGRWLSVDPLAAKYASTSPYVYVNNTPIFFIDKHGEEWVNPYTNLVQTTQKALIDEPNDRKLKKQLKEYQRKEERVNNIPKVC